MEHHEVLQNFAEAFAFGFLVVLLAVCRVLDEKFHRFNRKILYLSFFGYAFMTLVFGYFLFKGLAVFVSRTMDLGILLSVFVESIAFLFFGGLSLKTLKRCRYRKEDREGFNRDGI